MKLYLFSSPNEDSQTAFRKAPLDVFRVLSSFPQSALIDASLIVGPATKARNRVRSFLINLKRKMRLYIRCGLGLVHFEPGSILFMQYPYDKFATGKGEPEFSRRLVCRALHRSGGKMAFLVHDVNELRHQPHLNVEAERKRREAMVADADCIIVHNGKMLDWFAGNGVPREKLVNLEIFDYLSKFVPPGHIPFERVVSIAGSLIPEKAMYLSGLREIGDVEWHLYGSGFDNSTYGGPNVHYHGAAPADVIPSMLNRGFGLVWDGDSIDTCGGPTGQYLRYNNPHKLSLYLVAGLPVIIWREAAGADFVTRNGVGIVVDSLREINMALATISEADYHAMRGRALSISSKLRSGHFTRRAAVSMMELLSGSIQPDVLKPLLSDNEMGI